jgi:methyl-accepting chemotaxis protein
MSGIVEFFIIVASIAIVIQMAVMLAMLLSIRRAIDQFTRIANEFQDRMGPILLRVGRILDDSEDRIHSIMSDASEITRVARNQAQRIDRVMIETLDRVRAQVARADHVVSGTLELIEETGTKFRSTVWAPIQQFSAILKGVKAGIDFVRTRGRRGSESAAVTEDEELFI